MVKVSLKNIVTSYHQIRSNKYSLTCGKWTWQEVKITGWLGNKHDIQIEKWKVSKKNLIYKNLRRTNFSNLLYLNSEGISEIFYLCFLDIYMKMGQQEPLVEINVYLKEFQIQLESTTTFERKQHYVSCDISCRGTFIIEFHW